MVGSIQNYVRLHTVVCSTIYVRLSYHGGRYQFPSGAIPIEIQPRVKISSVSLSYSSLPLAVLQIIMTRRMFLQPFLAPGKIIQ